MGKNTKLALLSSSALIAAAMVLTEPNQAHAACGLVESGSNGTLTCDTDATGNPALEISGDNNIVTIGGATLTGTGTANNWPDGDSAIKVSGTGNDITVDVLSTVTGNIDGIHGTNTANTTTINNSGNITGTNRNGITLQDTGTITNSGTGTISGLQKGIMVINKAATITNSGTIKSTDTQNLHEGILFSGGSITNEVTGTIQANGSGIFVQSSQTTATITNSGSILSTGLSGITIANDTTLTNEATGTIEGQLTSGISLIAGTTTITNSGTIMGAQDAINVGDITTGTVINNLAGGLITTPGVVAISAGDGDEKVVNAGTITGDVWLGAGNDIFDNAGGTVNGNVDLGDGDDSLDLTGSTITGTITAGLGTDTLILSSTLSYDGSTTGFEALSITGGVSTLTGTQEYTAGVTLANGVELINNGTLTADIIGVANGNSLVNTGTITGNISLGDGADIFDNTGGIINGNVDLGDGNDIVDLSAFGTITGTFDTGLGNDILQISSTTSYDGSTSGFEALSITGGTITLTGTQTYSDTLTTLTIRSAGVTLTNGSSLSNSGILTASIVANANSTINNSGTIHKAVFGLDNTTITNDGFITIGSSNTTFFYTGVTNNSSFINNGSITLTDVFTPFGVILYNGSTLRNTGLISLIETSINSFTSFATGVLLKNNDTSFSNNILNNSGTISVITENAITTGVISTDLGAMIVNSGAIIASSNYGIVTGIRLTRPGTIDNSGSITATNINVDNVRATAISVEPFVGGNTTIINSGEITGITAISGGNTGFTEILNIDITNTGTITGSIGLNKGDDVLNNNASGSIIGDINLSFGADILNNNGGTITGNVHLGDGDDTFNNAGGTITGTISLGAGDDTLDGNDFGTISTIIDGGEGTDTIQFESAIPNSTKFTSFEIFEKTGTSVFDLTVDAVLGSVSAATGALSVNASLTADVAVQAAGTLKGIGTIIGDVVNGGTMAPGNSIGTLNVTGTYTQASTGIFDLETDGITGDQLNITGTAALDGTLNVTLNLTNTEITSGQVITFINTTAGVTGTFATVNAAVSQFFDASVTYNANTVQLLLTRSSFLLPFMTSQQAAIATVLDTFATTGSGYAANFVSVLRFTERTSAAAAIDQLPSLAAANLATPVYAARRAFLGSMANEANNFANGHYQTGKWTSFATGFGQFGDVDGSSNTSDLSFSMGGALITSIYGVNQNTRVGFAMGGAGSSMDVISQIDSNKHKSVQTAAFAHWSQNNFHLMAALGASIESFDLKRAIALESFSENGFADAGGYSLSAHLEGGYDINIGKLQISPTAFVQLSRFERGDYTETGLDNLGLMVAGKGLNSARTSLGFATNYNVVTARGTIITPEFAAYWDQELGDRERLVDAAFIADPSARFAITGQAADRHAGRFEGGLAVRFSNNFGLALRYEGLIGATATSHQLSGRLRWAW